MADVPKNGTAARQLWVAIGSIGVTLLFAGGAAMMWVGGIAYSVAQNARDIQNIGVRIAGNDRDTHELQITTARLEGANIEIETQFRAFDQLQNVRIAEDLRWRCQFMEKLYNQQCAGIAYFPQMARDK